MDMIRLTEKLNTAAEAQGVLSLPFETRQKSRFRASLEDGREVGVMLPRGGILRDGDRLRGPDGTVVVVTAAPEAVSTASHDDPAMLLRGAYHLGNRHVALQIGEGWIRYLADHVLDAMVEGLGLTVVNEQAAFEPEGGAFGDAGHTHGHHHHHGHS